MSHEDASGCFGTLVGFVVVMALVFFFVPFSFPWQPKGMEFCGRHDGFANSVGTMVDFIQNEGTIACNDGTVRWVRW